VKGAIPGITASALPGGREETTSVGRHGGSSTEKENEVLETAENSTKEILHLARQVGKVL